MEIDVASVDDVPELVDQWLALAAEQRQYDSHVLSDANAHLIRDELSRHASTDRLFVARDDGIVGFAMVAVERGTYQKDSERGIVEAIYVAPDRRSEGIGSDLLERAENALQERGVDHLTLEMLAANEQASRFYRRHGYDPHRVQLEKAVKSDTHSEEAVKSDNHSKEGE